MFGLSTELGIAGGIAVVWGLDSQVSAGAGPCLGQGFNHLPIPLST